MRPVTKTASAGDRGMSGIADPRLRERISDAVSEFQHRLEAALARPAPDTIEGLRKAADRLLRASARVLIELERSADPVRSFGSIH